MSVTPPRPEGKPAARGPLTGLRVVELSSYVATPLCGMVLGQLGADIIRVEPIGGAPDRSRLPRSATGTSLYWSGLNKGKRGVAVDLDRPEGRELVADLIVGGGVGAVGGVLVTNSDRWPELCYPALSARRADLVHVLLTGQRDGATAVDYTVQAGTGFPLVTGPANNTAPVNGVLPAWDLAAGLHLALGVLAAERERQLTGEGQHVRLALEDVALASAGALGYLAEAQLSGLQRSPSGNDVFGTYGRDFVTQDGVRFMMVVLTRSHWRRLVTEMGLTEAVGAVERALSLDLDEEAARYEARNVISALLERRFSQLDWSQTQEVMGRARTPAAPYRTFEQLVAHDSVRANPLFSLLDQPGVGLHLAPGSPLVMRGQQTAAQPAPLIGEHTDEVLGAAPGIDPDRLRSLHVAGVVA